MLHLIQYSSYPNNLLSNAAKAKSMDNFVNPDLYTSLFKDYGGTDVFKQYERISKWCDIMANNKTKIKALNENKELIH